jgi:mRNA-degrading endonuclease RelE of RelBE toxin-antitoxin system
VLDAVEKLLGDEPLRETRHRKPLRPNPVAPWELRVGALRVFYEVATSEAKAVHVLAIGKKIRNALWIAGREIKL